MGFDFEKDVEKLAYRVPPSAGGKDNLTRDIPEPSNAQVIEFSKAWRLIRADPEIAKTAIDPKAEDESDEDFFGRVIEAIPVQSDLALRVRADMRAAVAAVCSDTPSATEMEAWADRPQVGMFAYILGALTPEL